MRASRPSRAIMPDGLRPRDEAVDAFERLDELGQLMIVSVDALEEGNVAFQRQPRLGVENVDGPDALGFVAPADLEIVEVMGGGDLHRAGALLGV